MQLHCNKAGFVILVSYNQITVSVTMRSVVLGMFLCAVLPLINAGCFNMEHKTTVKFCQDTTDNTWHPTGSVWRNSKCFDCNCSADSMRCCDTMQRPVNYPDKCQVEYDYTTCTFEVFEKVSCSYTGGVLGK
ncbi:beta-microseminoprotein-like [Sinocyclocheilus rhinocerous]|uniref:beta-microseminoprotein-like n=1 Tax=Sinocyclocheilus rhinocerous TaxID=307959 RepID=UPI0007B79765|nr:PREDICTED: beta-microseminoprotein-like [Sinocyclocheilus rhinocerous]